MSDKYWHINSAKFLQNILLEEGYTCYLIGGSLISALRDNGLHKENDDIDFAILSNENCLPNILKSFSEKFFSFSWDLHPSVLSIRSCTNPNLKIDFFLFERINLNFYIKDVNWLHEKIYSFQTFKTVSVKLEGLMFETMFRPDLFLKTVYGNWHQPIDGYVVSGDTSHMRKCIFYVSEDNYDLIDKQVYFLNNFFKTVIVRRNFEKYSEEEINIIDDNIINNDYKDFVTYNDFKTFLTKNSLIVDTK